MWHGVPVGDLRELAPSFHHAAPSTELSLSGRCCAESSLWPRILTTTISWVYVKICDWGSEENKEVNN